MIRDMFDSHLVCNSVRGFQCRRMAEEIMKGHIKMYGLSSCAHCKSLRNYLIDSEVEFDWTYVDMLVGEERNLTLKELKAVNPSCTFPTLVVEEDVVVGYKKDKVRALIAAYQRKQ